MIPFETISEVIGSAKVHYIYLLNNLLDKISLGCGPHDKRISELQCIRGYIRALEYDIQADVNDDVTQEIYIKLLNIIDGESENYVIDPNVVLYSYPVGSVTVDWGNIGGNIYDQQDLIDLISTEAPALADGIITPGEIEIDINSLATFITQFSYRLQGDVYDPTQPTLQLDPYDTTYTRIDIIVGTTSGTYQKVTGIVSGSPTIPDAPVNTLILAQIYRLPSGDNLIIINNKGGYLPIVGGSLFGKLTIENGNDIILKAPNGSTAPSGIGRDSGDIIFQWGDGTEWRRLYINHYTGNLSIKEDETFDKVYIILNTENVCEPIPFTGATGTLEIDMTALSTIGAGLTTRNIMYTYPNVRAYNSVIVGAETKETEIKGFKEVIVKNGLGINVRIELDGIFGDGYILLSN